jgi:DNA repair exonuclease SbcCD nuclease subunit
MARIISEGQRHMNVGIENEVGTHWIRLLGDPHLGKNFRAGVPAHRLGDREKLVWEEFVQSINQVEGYHYHINMGDMFDKFKMPLEVIWRAAHEYRAAATKHGCKYIIIQGNHDVSRDADRVSAFDIFAEMVKGVPNIHVVTHKSQTMTFQVPSGHILVVPFHPFKNAEEYARELVDAQKAYWAGSVEPVRFLAAFGHWDIDNFGEEKTPNLVPAEILYEVTSHVFTGHVHLPTRKQVQVDQEGGVEVVGTGSMQPYTFAEDPEGRIYRTVTLAQAIQMQATENLCLRVVLQEGEELPTNVECLQMVKRRADAVDEDEDIEVQLMNFDLNALLADELRKAGVTNQPVIDMVMGSFTSLKETYTEAQHA